MHREQTHGAHTPDQLLRAAIVVPVKSFVLAKQRLTDHLDDARRTSLAQWCAERVIEAARPLEVFVVCDSDDIEQWATALGVQVIRSSTTGLNPSVEFAVAETARRGVDLAVIAHSDLPLANSFGHLVLGDAITIVPDYRYDGTNVLVIPTALAGRFEFQYGSGSFRRHAVEAVRHWPQVRILRDAVLARDLDTPDDLLDERMEGVRQWLQTSPDSRH